MKKTMTNEITIANTKEFIHLAKLADKLKLNRRVVIEKLTPLLDPKGTHIVGTKFLHNDVEVRCCWFLKLKNTRLPIGVWLDVPISMFNKLRYIVK